MAKILRENLVNKNIAKNIANHWSFQLNYGYATTLIQERFTIENNNLKWNAEKEIYELQFDESEENKYTIYDTTYLGRPQICIENSTSKELELSKAKTFLSNICIKKELSKNVSKDIIDALNISLSIETLVMLI